MMNYQGILTQIHQELSESRPSGTVAAYIPELAGVSPQKLGVHLTTTSGENFAAGDSEEPFSIQSITKVLMLARALMSTGRALWERVRVEPSGDPFNSLVQLEYECGIPRNPFINAGALVVSDVLLDQLANPKEDYLEFVRRISGHQGIGYQESVAASEWVHAHRNRAMVNLMKAFGNIRHDVEAVLDFYVHACAISMSCRELGRAFAVLANGGRALGSSDQVLSLRRTKRVNALMQTCGLYDEAGEFAFRVGLPGKSGVGGGVAAVHPGLYGVAVWSPPLNEKGNSAAGIAALERLTDLTGASIF